MGGMSEADARIKIDALLRQAGWRLPDDSEAGNGKPPNVRADYPVSEGGKTLYLDYVLEDDAHHPLAVLEAKKAELNPLVGKEQVREYANLLPANFALLSNGDTHYLWDLRVGGPERVYSLPGPEALTRRAEMDFSLGNFMREDIGEDYILRAQGANTPSGRRRLLRDYQLEAVQAVQNEATAGKRLFLLEMATGTGKTLISAALIRMFLRAGAVRRVLFLVDRLELEDQAERHLRDYLGNDYSPVVIYKSHKKDWNRARIVISTVQSLAFDGRFREFGSLDFDLLIVDEAHRSISGTKARAVLDHFVGYKLGLTATPRNFLKGVDMAKLAKNDPRKLEWRRMRDTYVTFGCGDRIDGNEKPPTFRYALNNGVKAGFLVNPHIIDARTEITTRLLSDEGAIIQRHNSETGEMEDMVFYNTDYEQKLFNDPTNRSFCRAFLSRAKIDPLSGEIGKTIIYCVNQHHAGKIAHILNELAAEKFPGKYQSDFARQVTSNVEEASVAAKGFANNNLGGKTNFLEDYDSSRTRACVTVGMMTTGYDCSDILNLCVMRPIFSPHEFIQIKGRGTRRHTFKHCDENGNERMAEKDGFMLFDFFAVVEYFESRHDYNEQLSLDISDGKDGESGNSSSPKISSSYTCEIPDEIARITETAVGALGLQVDRQMTLRFIALAQKDERIASALKHKDGAKAEKLVGVLVKKHYRSRNEFLKDEVRKFTDFANLPEEWVTPAAKALEAIIDNPKIRQIVESGHFALLMNCPELTDRQWLDLPSDVRKVIMDYVRKADLSPFQSAASA